MLKKSQKGWILVDSLVGMIFLSTAVIALLFAFTQATKGTIASTNRTQATYLAQQALEDLKSQDGESTITPQSAVPNGIFHISSPSLITIPEIENDVDHLSTYLKPYQVTVSWSDSSGGPTNKKVTMVGYYYVIPK